MTAANNTDWANERAVLGDVLLTEKSLKPLLTVVGLRPEHFRYEPHVFAAMVRLFDRGEPVTTNTVAAELVASNHPVQPAAIDDLLGHAGPVSELVPLARRVKEAHEWRQVAVAASQLQKAALTRDKEARSAAEDLLATPADLEPRSHSVEQVRAEAIERLQSPQAKPKGVPFPFDRLNGGGGMRPAQLTVLGARQKQGKSVFADMCLDQAFKHRQSMPWVGEPHLYLLEMSEQERVERFLARLALIDNSRIVDGKLSDEELRRLAEASERIPCGMTDAAGWTPSEVIRHARFHGYKFVVVDHMHCFQLREEADVSDCVRLFRNFAAEVGAHVIVCAQLNEKRVVGQQRPRPTMTDLRGSGMISAFAHYVTFVYRPDDEKGREGDEGEIWHAACRSGRPYVGEKVRLKGEWMRFEVDITTEDWRASV